MLISRTIIFFVFPSLFCPFFRYIKIQHKRIRSDCCQVFFYLYYSNAPLSPLHTPCFLSGNITTTATSVWKYMHATRHCPTLCYIPFFFLSCFAISFSLYFPSNNSSWYNNEGVCVFIAEAHFPSNSTFLKSRYFDSKPIALTPL